MRSSNSKLSVLQNSLISFSSFVSFCSTLHCHIQYSAVVVVVVLQLARDEEQQQPSIWSSTPIPNQLKPESKFDGQIMLSPETI